MNLGKGKGKKAQRVKGVSMNKPGANTTTRWIWLIIIILIAGGLISWVDNLGKKAEETIKVVMLAKDVHKNQQITADMIKPYDMLVGEYEKYSIVKNNGKEERRVITWDERGVLNNTFAAYPMQANTVSMFRNFVKSRTDNTDSVLYSFPGKEIYSLDIGGEIADFKTFLKPGDMVNIRAHYTDTITDVKLNRYGEEEEVEYEVFKTEDVFNGIILADILNSNGESVLDIYEGYNEMSVWDQARLDEDEGFKERTEPSKVLMALTPEEASRYNYFLAKSGIEFKVSLPQRAE